MLVKEWTFLGGDSSGQLSLVLLIPIKQSSNVIKRCPTPESAQPVIIERKTTKRLLAAELGTVSETSSRILATFRQRKLVAVKGKTLTVPAPS